MVFVGNVQRPDAAHDCIFGGHRYSLRQCVNEFVPVVDMKVFAGDGQPGILVGIGVWDGQIFIPDGEDPGGLCAVDVS